jgi:hypothetical protein
MDKYDAYELLIEHFNFSDDKSYSLDSDVKFSLSNDGKAIIKKLKYSINVSRTFNERFHKIRLEALRNYADENAVQRYMENEGFKYLYNHSLYKSPYTDFVIFPIEQKLIIHKYLTKHYEDSEYFIIEEMNDEYCIAYK